ncbi:3D domain-containing protein [Patescibacteria group bacterium]|nr:3D domain-containing protein [Patescibacteria group bacterium]MBU1705788.1 3D domain-containing protein [Patescibacteria group bacterium]
MFNLFTTIMLTGVMAVNAVMPAEVITQTENPVVEPVQVEQTLPDNYRVVTVTAYTSEPGQTDSTPCISSDGSNICERYAKGELICAAGDRNVPLGSKFYVEGYGTCSVADRMNIRYNGTGRVDIYLGYDTPSAFQWGLRKVPVARIN